MTWKPIYTIPRDGTKVTVLCKDGIIGDIYYCDKSKEFRTHELKIRLGDNVDDGYFTHWRLPQLLPEKGTTMWQPINTIPRDGTKVDLLDNLRERVLDVYFKNGEFFRDDPEDGVTLCVSLKFKTHWMPSPPLPEPPKKREPREVWLYERADGELENFIARIYHPDNPGCFGGSNKKKIVKFREVMEND